MRTLVDHLASYAAYHRDRRNIATHFVGIPMIVVAVAGLLSRPVWDAGAVPLSPAVAALAVTCLFYLRLDARLGVAMTIVMGLSGWAGAGLAALSTATWLAASLGLFVVGWAFQFVGHYFEGRKPAFVDDLMGLVIGPLFVVAEAGFAVGARDAVRQAIEERVGPTRAGRPAARATTATR